MIVSEKDVEPETEFSVKTVSGAERDLRFYSIGKRELTSILREIFNF